MTKSDSLRKYLTKSPHAKVEPIIAVTNQQTSRKSKSKTACPSSSVSDLLDLPSHGQSPELLYSSTILTSELAAKIPPQAMPDVDSNASLPHNYQALNRKPETFAEALSIIELDGTCSPKALRSFQQSLAWIEKKCATSSAKENTRISLPCDPIKLRPILENIRPGQHKIGVKRWANLRADLSAMQRKTGWLPPSTERPLIRTEAWKSLIKIIPHLPAKSMFSRFAVFCENKELTPTDIRPDHLDQYEIEIRTNGARLHPEKTIAAMRFAWNAAKRDHPESDIIAMPRKRHPNQIRLDNNMIPTTFFDDLSRYIERLRNPVLFDNSFSRRVPESTIRSRVSLLKLCPSVLIKSGWTPDSFTSLQTVVTPIAVRRILESYYSRNCQDSGWTTGARSTAAILTTVAREWGQLSKEEFEEVKRICLSVRPPRNSFPKRTRERLRQFDDRKVERRFLTMPSTLWKKAQAHAAAGRVKRAAQMAKYALGFSILLDKPLRIQNLAELDLNLDFLRDTRGNIVSIRIEGGRTTKGAPIIEAVLGSETQRMLKIYLSKYRHALLNGDSTALFPGAIEGHAAKSGFATQFSKLIKKELGLTVNPHLVRAYIGTIILDENPRAIVLAQRMLDHRSPETTAKFYAMQRGRSVGREYADVLNRRLRRLRQ